MVLKNKKLLVYIIGIDLGYSSWLQAERIYNIEEADLVIIVDSDIDIDPSLYEEPMGKYTVISKDRDSYEITQTLLAVKLNKKIIGIGRGLHILNVVAGGKIVQHMNHPIKHLVRFYDNTVQYVSSTHHQLVKPFNLIKSEYSIIAHAEGISDVYLNGYDSKTIMPVNKHEKSIEPEIVYYNNINGLGFQCNVHELNISSPMVDISKKLIELLRQDLLSEVVKLKIPIKELLTFNFKIPTEIKQNIQDGQRELIN